ncbi:MAG: 2-oxoacid:acceptor oxidoreductase family protein, partial [Actinomycetota bacterium]
TVDIAAGAKDDATIIINAEEDAATLSVRGGLDKWKVYTVPATKIALETIKRAIPNTPLIGALTKVSGLFEIDGVVEQVRESLSKKFGDEVVNANLEAVRRGYDEVSG